MEEKSLINKVEQSGLITVDLEEFYPKTQIIEFDLKPFLVKELVLMEKYFREELKKIDWRIYSGKVVAVFCSNDALIPMWAYMLVGSYLQPFAQKVSFGNKQQVEDNLLMKAIENMESAAFNQVRVVIKGCGDRSLPASAYLAITQKLQPVVQSLMYGEPCSAVPVYKKPKSTQ